MGEVIRDELAQVFGGITDEDEPVKTLVRIDAVCAALNISPAIVYRQVSAGMPVFRLNKRVFRFNLDEVRKWIGERSK
jgi:hypothetical protein